MTEADFEKWISAQRAAVWSAATAAPLARAATHSRKNATFARAEKLDDASGFCIRDKTKGGLGLPTGLGRLNDFLVS
jgi:hypothetical protein